jgi:hypothetical protein
MKMFRLRALILGFAVEIHVDFLLINILDQFLISSRRIS